MDANGFRRSVRELVRALGVLDDARTPCGADLSVREAYALDFIGTAEAAGSPLSQSDLQAFLGVDKSNVTRVVQQLVAAARIEQRVGDGDGRVRRLHLTAKGRKTARNIEAQSLSRFAAVLERIAAAERQGVLKAIEILRAALDADAAKEKS